MVYIFIVLSIRVFGKKELAQLSVTDLVFILLISNSVQNAMVGPDNSLLGGIIAATALFITNYGFKKIIYRNKKIGSWIQGESVMLIYKGVLQLQNLKRSDITIEELEAAVREHGVANIKNVDLATLEVDGNISIISHNFQKRSTIAGRKKHKFKGKIIKN